MDRIRDFIHNMTTQILASENDGLFWITCCENKITHDVPKPDLAGGVGADENLI
jgi:hypothetical protein